MKKALIFSIIVGFLMACGSSTKIVNHWKDPSLKEADIKELNNVMVAVLAANESSRRAAEDKIAEINPAFVQSYMVLNEKLTEDLEASKKLMEGKDFDGVLVFRLVDKDKSETYVPGGYGGGYYGYHTGYWGAYYDPGYYTENVTYYVETLLFSLKQDKLLWTGVTSTLNPTSIKSAMSSIAETVYTQLKKDIEISSTESNE